MLKFHENNDKQISSNNNGFNYGMEIFRFYIRGQEIWL
ncbi:hypothetical protein BN437_0587 [Erwinia amylovora NBRC 12687 = CFBP 1232]|uniref:Uncharacterized protein n=1 Tax=Erwinia amylovora NBRC 12687 = CFBP 1232 TaxID=1219359 RepID=A0A831EIS3_ERWAM|nr:hypothetical protein BN437_0587 [Erwinia amylovora NBRC 12687 = CFBP 1232]